MPPKREKAPLFQPKDMVLAKMTGFPAWPSFVMPSDMIPSAILKAKKKTTNTCVIFIPDGDFNWMNEKSLEALSPEKLQSKIDKIPKDKLKTKAKKKSTRTSNVVEALVAASGLQFDVFMEELEKAKASFNEKDEAEADEYGEEAEEEEEEAVVGAEDTEDKPEHSTEETEELTVDAKDPEKEDPVLPARTNTRHAKRKPGRPKTRALRSAREEPSETEPAAQTPESDDAVVNGEEAEEADDDDENENLSENEDAQNNNDKSTNDAVKVTAKEPSPLRKRTRASRDVVEDDVPETEEGSEKQASEETEEPLLKKPTRDIRAGSPKISNDKDRQHQLWLCRIKLQRSLIQRNQPVTPKDPKSFPPPTVDELLMARIILQKLADFPVTVELLRDTKIHKVLKCIVKDEDLEYPESFRLHEKCKELLEKWQDLIDSLKQGKTLKTESRIGSTAPEDSEISGIEIKNAADKGLTGKVGV